jgi:hypothetical protein
VRRYREALILAGATGDSAAGRPRGMGPKQLEALAERMALDLIKSSGTEDPVRRPTLVLQSSAVQFRVLLCWPGGAHGPGHHQVRLPV